MLAQEFRIQIMQEETANLAELMVRQQVCASIMKQINNSKSIILSLLGG